MTKARLISHGRVGPMDALGRVEVGLQPEPADYHATDVVLKAAGWTRGIGWRVRSRLRAGLGAGSRPRSQPHRATNPMGTDEGTSPRYLALAALKAPQNLNTTDAPERPWRAVPSGRGHRA